MSAAPRGLNTSYHFNSGTEIKAIYLVFLLFFFTFILHIHLSAFEMWAYRKTLKLDATRNIRSDDVLQMLCLKEKELIE